MKDYVRAGSARPERAFRVAVLLAVEKLVLGALLRLGLGALAGVPRRVLLRMLLRVGEGAIGLGRVAGAAEILLAGRHAATSASRFSATPSSSSLNESENFCTPSSSSTFTTSS